ncbi:MAG: NUDIX domain-containing protein [Rickettsiales bacterium]|jgi:putative (di)nucleoside polyphosphate hydrolase|nr:NUDIX domain-containing protein [Rickettsiales bacterium]
MRLREAVGAIVLDGNGNVIAFRRADFPENWQGPEGGLEEGETPEEALARELEEEVGLARSQFRVLGRTKTFIPYLFGDGKKSRQDCDGQRKMFFLIKITDPLAQFSYDRVAEEVEFTDHRTVTAPELVELVPQFKRDLYRSVLTEFGLL